MSKKNASEQEIRGVGLEETNGAADTAEPGADLDTITIHHSVIAAMARLAALRVPGVAEMSGSFTDGIASFIGKNLPDRGVKVEVDDQKVVVDLYVVIEYGVRIPDIACQLQGEVRRAIEDMTGKQVSAVNVVIQDIRLPEKPKSEGEEP